MSQARKDDADLRSSMLELGRDSDDETDGKQLERQVSAAVLGADMLDEMDDFDEWEFDNISSEAKLEAKSKSSDKRNNFTVKFKVQQSDPLSLCLLLAADLKRCVVLGLIFMLPVIIFFLLCVWLSEEKKLDIYPFTRLEGVLVFLTFGAALSPKIQACIANSIIIWDVYKACRTMVPGLNSPYFHIKVNVACGFMILQTVGWVFSWLD